MPASSAGLSSAAASAGPALRRKARGAEQPQAPQREDPDRLAVVDRQRPRRQPRHPGPGAGDAQRLEPHLPAAGELAGDRVAGAGELVQRLVALPGGDHPDGTELARRQQRLAEWRVRSSSRRR